ncbi:hypothetical protein NUA08_004320 [Yersinia enterocolitica]|nr:hypothetical protein [Yersinia enterocolitica]
MNNDLEQFSEETLQRLISGEYFPSTHAAKALARIALAAKRAEGLPGNIYPDISGEITALEKILKWIVNLEVPTTGATNRAILLGNTIELLRDCQKPIVATPQLNSPEILDGWKLVPIELINNLRDTAHFEKAWCADVYGDFIGTGRWKDEYEQLTITCKAVDELLSPLPAAPEKENG